MAEVAGHAVLILDVQLSPKLEALLKLFSTEGAPVDVSLSHDPFAPEGTVTETPAQDAPAPASDAPEPEGVALDPETGSEPQDAPEPDTQPEAIASAGESVEVPGEPGEATNLDTGEVTAPGEQLPEVPDASA